jgi:dihydroxyacetone kinase-like protein
MQKFVNRPEDMVKEDLRGFVKCYPELVANTESDIVLKYRGAPVPGKVGIVTGGGSGHDPAFIGYIGRNMVDAVAVGSIFVPPAAAEFYTAFKNADAGAGVACLFGNYVPDVENIEKAVGLAARDGIRVSTVIAKDDVSNADRESRRGLAGEVLMWKAGGAAAALGYDLDGVTAAAKKAIDHTRSIGVGLSSCIIPMVGRPSYLIENGTMEIGVGHHGMASLDTCKLKTADEAVDIMLCAILGDMPVEKGEEVAVLVSGMGNTMLMELHLLYNHIYDALTQRGIRIHWSYTGNYFTSLDMMGATVTLMRLDGELKKLLDAPADSVAFKQF